MEVLIAGGGPAALETALALQNMAGELVAVTLVAPDADFVYRPLSVGEPFGVARPRRFSLAAIAADRGFGLRRDRVATVEPDAHRVRTAGGVELRYDALVLAIGVRPEPAVPGAITFRGPDDAQLVQEALEGIPPRKAAGVAFVAAPATAWTLPIYEMALLTAGWARERRMRIEPWVITHEARPLGVFGPTASAAVKQRLSASQVLVWTGASVDRFEDGRLWIEMEGGIAVSVAVALARPVGQPVHGLPRDEQGFTPTDDLGRVPGVADVFAVGDMTMRPLKQGGLATEQADAAASAIAAAAGADVEVAPFKPRLRAVLLTGGAPLYLERSAGGEGEASDTAPWWPPHKIAGHHLPPYLAAHPEVESGRAPAMWGEPA
jgi:sulfide:quinone oxidoreductase